MSSAWRRRSLITEAGTKGYGEGFRIPAHEIETLVVGTLERLLLSRMQLFQRFELDRYSPTQIQETLSRARRVAATIRKQGGSETIAFVRTLLDRVTVADQEVRVVISASGIRNMLDLDPIHGPQGTPLADSHQYSINVPATLKRCGGASRPVVTDDGLSR